MGAAPSRNGSSSTYSSTYPGARRSGHESTPAGVTSSMATTASVNGSTSTTTHRNQSWQHSHNQQNRSTITNTSVSHAPPASIRTPSTSGTTTMISSSRIHSGPGAYLVEPSGTNSTLSASVFRVCVPEGVSSGEEFQVYAGNRVVRVRCPQNARPGHFLQITVPPDPTVSALNRAALTAAGGDGLSPPSNDTSDDYTTPGVMIDGEPTPQGQGYLVPIPAGVVGNQFPIFINSQQLLVTIPPNAQEGMLVRIYAPIRSISLDRPPSTPTTNNNSSIIPTASPPSNQTQMFEVVVPPGVKPNQPFALLAGGQRVLVTCPANARPGQRIRFQLPMALLQPPKGKAPPSLQYEKHGWARTIRLSDFKFQWVRMQDDGSVNLSTKFDLKTSAYVRQLDFFPGKDNRMRTGLLRLVSAPQAVVDSNVKDDLDKNQEVISYFDLTSIQLKSFEEKTSWFFNVCRNRLGVDWHRGHVRINVRRDFLVEDSIQAVMSLSRKDLRRMWRFEFIGESGVDAGGLAREWFELVTKEVFNPDRGLWLASITNQMCLLINPTSGLADPEEHLIYFRFLGRVLGKALFDQQLVSCHMVRYMYKHLLGWPISFDDLQYVDEEYYSNLKKIWDMSDDELSALCLDFTTVEKAFGKVQNIDLIPNGSNVEVTKDNLHEYLEACFQFRLLGQIRPQLTELLLGFYDIIPEPLLTIFDFQELELLMCGVPEIDMNDWKKNTEYSGMLRRDHQVVDWFWEVVECDLDREMKARCLQFSTGTSGVPSRGFSFLQGSDGNIRKFTVHGVNLSSCIYPRAHTCFNRIDLPLYKSKKQLKENLTLAIQLEATGFGLE